MFPHVFLMNISVVVITYVIPFLLLWFSSPEDFLDQMSPLPPDLEKPDCAKILDLPYSIHAFQHLRVSVLSVLSCTFTYIFLLFSHMYHHCHCPFGFYLSGCPREGKPNIALAFKG